MGGNQESGPAARGGAEAQSLHWRWHKSDDIYPYEAEQRNGIEIWYGMEAISAPCRTRVDIDTEQRRGTNIARGARWAWW